MKKIGEIIKSARLSKGMTQNELANLVGYKSRSAIGKIETGEREPSKYSIAKFAEVLDIPLIDVLSYLDWSQESEMYKKFEEIIEENKTSHPESEKSIVNMYNMMNKKQKQNLESYAEFILKNPSNA